MKMGNGAPTHGGATFGSGIGEIPQGSLEALRAQGLGAMDTLEGHMPQHAALGDNFLQTLLPTAGQILQQGIPTSVEDVANLTTNAALAVGAGEVAKMSPDDRFNLLKNMPESARNELLKKLPVALRDEYLNRLSPQERAAVEIKIGVKSSKNIWKWVGIAAGIGISGYILLKLMGGNKSERRFSEEA